LPAAASVAWNGDHFVAVGDKGAILVSSDGSHWTQAPVLTNHPLMAIAAGGFPNVQFVAVGRLGDILYSTDGVLAADFEYR
jgi:photosystem II stability/assembly factor-like uncharacterized protein